MLHTHVRMLRAKGIEAAILHRRAHFRPTWMESSVPIVHLGRRTVCDLLVVPEIFAAEPALLALAQRRVVFVQASSYIGPGLRGASSYRELGYECAIATMPHVREIVERHYGVPAPLVPPCIAPYFFARPATLQTRRRKRQVVLCPKPWCRDLGIARQMLRDGLPRLGWRLVELSNQPHREVARVLRESALHVSVNCHESFNATVPEAMAAGAIAVCYEAFGGRDFLRDGRNAFVFPTHHAYPLLERVMELAQSYGDGARLVRMRRAAYATAMRYTEAQTEKALMRFYSSLLRG